MPPKNYVKKSTTATPQLLSAALSIVRVLLESSPKSMNLAMAETCLKQEEASQAAPVALPLEPAPAAPVEG